MHFDCAEGRRWPEAPPRKEPDDGDGGWLRPKEMGLFKHVDPVYGAQHQAKFAAEMAPIRQLHKERSTLRRMHWQ
jgi:hypothetical protein